MEFAPCAEVTRLSGGIACSADGACSTHRDNVFREGVQAAADWCLPHARGNVSKGGWGQAFQCASVPRAWGTSAFVRCLPLCVEAGEAKPRRIAKK